MNKKKNIKILVGYHKKEHIYNSELLVPIHCGRELARKRVESGLLAQSEFNWLVDNTIGDDTSENISALNNSINEMTGIYWGWKNYDKLGNPDYIGFNHYRRYFDIPYSRIDSILNRYDFIKTPHKKKKISFYDDWVNGFNESEFLNKAFDICKNINPEEGNKIEEFFHGKIGNGWCNMFVLPKEEFFAYCEFLFPILLNLPKDEKYERLPGMFAERLTSYYMYKLSLKKKALSASRTNIMQKNVQEYLAEHIFSIKKNTIYKTHTTVTLFGLKIRL